ncbi:MAG: LysM domain-containing protein [Geodermatophilaceae bacterium]
MRTWSTKGETLTSIAKAHKVGVEDLQKFNHIENDRALQIGQTIMIPTRWNCVSCGIGDCLA